MDEPDPIDDDSTPEDMLHVGYQLGELGRLDEEVAVYAELVARFGDDPEVDVQRKVARALGYSGMACAKSDRRDESRAMFGEVVKRFGDASDDDLNEQVAMALLGQSMLVGDAEAVALTAEAVERLSESTDDLLLARAYVALISALMQAGWKREITTALGDVMTRFGDDGDPQIEGCLAICLSNAGIGLTGASATVDELVLSTASFDRMCTGLEIDPSLRAEMAQQFAAVGMILGERTAPSDDDRGYLEQGIAAFSELASRFGESDDLTMRDRVARGLVYKGMTLDARLLRRSDAVAAFDDALEQFDDAHEPELQAQVAKALIGKGDALVGLGLPDEALAAYAEVFARFAGSDDAWVQQLAARGLARNGALLFGLGRIDDALTVLGDVSDRFGAVPGQGMRAEVASVLVGIAGLLTVLGRDDESLAVFDDVLRRGRDVPGLRYQVACAVCGRSGVLDRMGRSEEAVAALDEVMDWPTDSDDARLRFILALARSFKGNLLHESLGRSAEARTVLDALVATFEHDDNGAVQGVVANARDELS